MIVPIIASFFLFFLYFLLICLLTLLFFLLYILNLPVSYLAYSFTSLYFWVPISSSTVPIASYFLFTSSSLLIPRLPITFLPLIFGFLFLP